MEGRAMLFVGPSGSGRFTLAQAMGITFQIPRVVSYTTRPQRERETYGKEYFFVTEEEFSQIEQAGELIESVTFNGFRYGIRKEDCDRLLKESGSFFAILSPEGCEIFKKLFDKTLTIFIYADKETVIERQRLRGDDEPSIERHSNHFDEVMEYKSSCDISIANYDLASTAQELTARIEQFLGLTYHPDSAY